MRFSVLSHLVSEHIVRKFGRQRQAAHTDRRLRRRHRMLETLESRLALDGAPSGGTGGGDPTLLQLVVSTTLDEVDGDHSAGDLSLREAVILANSHVGDVEIELPAGLYGLTIPRASLDANAPNDAATGDLFIRNEFGTTRITGASAGTTIVDANGLDRAFTIARGDVTLASLTIRGGNATEIGTGTLGSPLIQGNGGAIFVGDSLHLIDSIVETSHAPGLGGGLYVDEDAALTIAGSTIRANWAMKGGGLWLEEDAQIAIHNSRFLQNTATDAGGGMYLREPIVEMTDTTIRGNYAAVSGGGIHVDRSDLNITSTHISENFAGMQGGGIYLASDFPVEIASSTISSNTTGPDGSGGGIYIHYADSVTISDTDITNNDAGGASGYGGGIDAARANPSDVTSVLQITGGSIANNTAVNGGGIALGQKVNANIRGVSFFQNTAEIRGGGLYSDAGSLEIADSTFAQNLSHSAGGGLFVDRGTDLSLVRSDFTSNQAGGRGGGVYLGEDLNVEIVGGTYEGNTAEGYGGGVYIADNVVLNLDSATFRANVAEEGAGVSQAEDGELIVQNGRFESNIASENGGAISSTERAQLTVETSQFVGNQAGYYGGAVYVDSEANATIEESVFRENAAAHGGGIAVAYRATVVVTESSIENNSATQQGGGVFNDSSTLRLDHTEVRGNRVVGFGGEDAPLYGGGIFNLATSASATLELNRTNVTDNAIDSRAPALSDDDYLLLGAGIANLTGSSQFTAIVQVNSSNISRNIISFAAQGELDTGDIAGKGAGIYSNATTTAPARVFIERSTINGNQINLNYVPDVDDLFASGGGIHVEGNSSLTVTYSTISNNVAAASQLNSNDDTVATGGGITFASRTATARMVINHATISGNSVSAINQADGEGFTSASGGGISMFAISVGPASSPAEVAFSTIAFNRAYTKIDANLPDDDDDPTPQPQSPLTAGIYGRGSALSIYQSLGGSNESIVVERAAGSTITNFSPAVSYTDLGYNLLVGQESNAWLDKLAYNGGTTQTHALLPGSPAIDAGNPAFNPGTYDPPLSMDQRGQPRVLDGGGDGIARIDIGSYEYSRTFLFGDLNGDGQVGVRDLIVVQQNLGNGDPTYAQGDLDADGLVDAADAGIIAAHLGSRLPASPSASAGAVVARVVTRAAANAQPSAIPSAAERPAAREVRRRAIVASSVDHVFAATAIDSAESLDAGKLRVRRRLTV